MKKIFIFLFLINFLNSYSQQISRPAFVKGIEKKGDFFLIIGINKSFYSATDIQFSGFNHSFSLKDIKAKDKVGFSQINFLAGYLFADNYSIDIGWDHIKYLPIDAQETYIDGAINTGNSLWDGSYTNHPIIIKSDLIDYQSNNGFNYVHAGITRYTEIYKPLSEKLVINWIFGPEFGFIRNNTSMNLLTSGEISESYFSGFGASVKTGLHIVVYHDWLVQLELKGIYASIPELKPKGENKIDKASQKLLLLQTNLQVGVILPLVRKK